jgi:hypothetical protein
LRIDDTGLPDLDVARQHGGADRRLDRGVGELLFGAFDERPRLRDEGGGLDQLGPRDDELAGGGALAVLSLFERALRVVERRLRHQLLLVQLLGALVVAPRERHIGRLGLDLVLLQLGGGGFARGLGCLQVGASLAKPGVEVFPCRVRRAHGPRQLPDRHPPGAVR